MEWIAEEGYYRLRAPEPFVAYFSTKRGFPPVGEFLWLAQAHTGIVQVAPCPTDSVGDGFVADEPGLWLAVKTADCGSVFLFDPEHRALGLAHAGWRGALLGVHLNALDLMAGLFGTRPGVLLAAMGPMVCGNCYRVGEEVAQLFPGFARKREGDWLLDLPGFIGESLKRAGLREENIILPPACTMEDAFLWSARRDGYRGRNWAFAAVLRD